MYDLKLFENFIDESERSDSKSLYSKIESEL